MEKPDIKLTVLIKHRLVATLFAISRSLWLACVAVSPAKDVGINR